MPEALSINSDLFRDMRDQYDTVLNSIVKLLEAGDEGEITVKIAIDKRSLFDEVDSEGNSIEKQKIDVSWDVTRVIKAKKFKLDGHNTDEFFLEQDEDGEFILKKVEQVSMFDSQGGKIVEMRR